LEIATRVTAAVFGDGAAFGDRKQIDAIMAKRAEVVRQFDQVMTRVCILGKQGASVDQMRETLEKENLQGPAQTQISKFFGTPVRPPETMASRIAKALSKAQEVRALLTAPVLNQQGRLYINPGPPPSCDLH
jgi:hypothetical protein